MSREGRLVGRSAVVGAPGNQDSPATNIEHDRRAEAPEPSPARASARPSAAWERFKEAVRRGWDRLMGTEDVTTSMRGP